MALLEESIAIKKTTSPGNWSIYNLERRLGQCLILQARYDEAESLLLSGYEGLISREAQIWRPQRASFLTKTARSLAQLYEDLGNREEVAKWRGELKRLEQKYDDVLVQPGQD